MRKVVLFIAMSLDRYIADMNGSVDWHNGQTSTDKIRFVHESLSNLVKRLKEEDRKDIWICGGASIVQQLMQDGLIDKFYISIISTILGSGVRLFGPLDAELKLKLIETRYHNGIIEVVYEKR